MVRRRGGCVRCTVGDDCVGLLIATAGILSRWSRRSGPRDRGTVACCGAPSLHWSCKQLSPDVRRCGRICVERSMPCIGWHYCRAQGSVRYGC